ncbi:MAG: EamA family transporter [Pseudomonadota bacterium]
MSNTARAVIMMIIGMMLIPVGDAFAKLISGVEPYSGAGLAWARFVVGLAVALPLALLLSPVRGLSRFFWGSQALRGVLLAAVIGLIIQGAQVAPLADVFGAFFIGPAIATLLARFALREQVDAIDVGAVVLGFLGVLLVVRPGGDINPGLFWALGAGVCYGGFLTVTRWSAGSGPPFAQLAALTGFGALALTPLGMPEFLELGVRQPGWLLGSGLTSITANLFAILAFREARAGLLNPLVYVQLLSATALSLTVFGDALDGLAAIGLALILLAGLGRFLIPRRPAPTSEPHPEPAPR